LARRVININVCTHDTSVGRSSEDADNPACDRDETRQTIERVIYRGLPSKNIPRKHEGNKTELTTEEVAWLGYSNLDIRFLLRIHTYIYILILRLVLLIFVSTFSTPSCVYIITNMPYDK